jgi:hypothetical protein
MAISAGCVEAVYVVSVHLVVFIREETLPANLAAIRRLT